MEEQVGSQKGEEKKRGAGGKRGKRAVGEGEEVEEGAPTTAGRGGRRRTLWQWAIDEVRGLSYLFRPTDTSPLDISRTHGSSSPHWIVGAVETFPLLQPQLVPPEREADEPFVSDSSIMDSRVCVYRSQGVCPDEKTSPPKAAEGAALVTTGGRAPPRSNLLHFIPTYTRDYFVFKNDQ